MTDTEPRTAVIAGVGPGLGASIARRFAAEGLHVARFARTASYLDDLAAELDADTRGAGLAVPTDLADPDAVADSYWTLVEQDRSAWTVELDVRPHVESF
jgi:short-subunit dehydrogenase